MIRPFFRRVLADVDRFCMQSEESARRLIDLGADPDRVIVTGSLKFDSLRDPGPVVAGQASDRVLRYFRMTSGAAGDRRRQHDEGEEESCCRRSGASSRRRRDPLLVIAPRNPDRFGEVARLARKQGSPRSADAICRSTRSRVRMLSFSIRSASWRSSIRSRPPCLSAAAWWIIGGHNILEPAVFGKPIVFGPYMQNFKEIADAFVTHDAGIQVHNARGLGDALLALLNDPVRRARLGAAARALVESNRGAKDKSLDVIAQLLPVRAGREASCASSASCNKVRLKPDTTSGTTSGPYLLLHHLYCRLARARRRYYQRRPHLRRRLGAPVISVGNLTVGGSGKTPLVAEIARLLLAMGERPAILSRGYARRFRATASWLSAMEIGS